MNLQERAKQLQASSVLMDNREKGEIKDLLNLNLTIINYDFMSGDDGEYSIIHLAEENNLFFFGGSVITEILQQLDKEGYYDQIKKEGLPVKFTSVKSKNNRYYTKAELYPEN